MKITKNFSMSEYTRSYTARRNNIDNQPPEALLPIITNLFENVVQLVRDEFGPTRINSGYRSEQLNKVVGGSARSQHCLGEAVDLEVRGISNKLVADWIITNCKFDQLILEFHTEGDDDSGWIHVSCKGNLDSNRSESLVSYHDYLGRVKYDVYTG